MTPGRSPTSLYRVLKAERYCFKPEEIVRLFRGASEHRVQVIASRMSDYISSNLPAAFERRTTLAHYRTNPYVLMTTASVMNLDDSLRFADFLFNSKLYMALETSFGKLIEAAFVDQYPLGSNAKWEVTNGQQKDRVLPRWNPVRTGREKAGGSVPDS